MEILLWLAPAAAVTLLMMCWAAWAGRPRVARTERSEADYEKLAKAITKRHPAADRPRPAPARDRSTGIAVRPSRSVPPTRRSA